MDDYFDNKLIITINGHDFDCPAKINVSNETIIYEVPSVYAFELDDHRFKNSTCSVYYNNSFHDGELQEIEGDPLINGRFTVKYQFVEQAD